MEIDNVTASIAFLSLTMAITVWQTFMCIDNE